MKMIDSALGNNGHYARKLNSEEAMKLEIEKVSLNQYKQEKLESDARKNWDLFYKRNGDRFFKDRHWTSREFEELAKMIESEKPVLLEVGCGVGNFIFPLIADKTTYFIQACDFSPRAIDIVKENDLYSEDVCNAFVCDVTKQKLTDFIPENSVDVATLIFVLSTINPLKMLPVLLNIKEVLKPGGVLLLRDYGLYDQAMLRFGRGSKLGDHFYVRQDGTRSFFFSEEDISNFASEVGLDVVMNKYVTRHTVNQKEDIDVPRIYIQAKLKKSDIKKGS